MIKNHLPSQDTRAPSLIWNAAQCYGAAENAPHNRRARAPESRSPRTASAERPLLSTVKARQHRRPSTARSEKQSHAFLEVGKKDCRVLRTKPDTRSGVKTVQENRNSANQVLAGSSDITRGWRRFLATREDVVEETAWRVKYPLCSV